MCVVSRAGCKEGPFPADSMLLVVRYSFFGTSFAYPTPSLHGFGGALASMNLPDFSDPTDEGEPDKCQFRYVLPILPLRRWKFAFNFLQQTQEHPPRLLKNLWQNLMCCYNVEPHARKAELKKCTFGGIAANRRNSGPTLRDLAAIP